MIAPKLSIKNMFYNNTYLVSALLLCQHDLPEGALAQHLDEVEVVQRHLVVSGRTVVACATQQHFTTTCHDSRHKSIRQQLRQASKVRKG